MSSCSQNCENCGPSLSLFSIGAAAAVSPTAFGCLNGDPLPEGTLGYQSYSSSDAGSSSSSSNLNCFWHIGGDTYASAIYNSNYYSNGNARSNYSINSTVDGYGRYLEDITASSTVNAAENYKSNSFAYYGAPGPCSATNANSNGKTNINCTFVTCDFSQCEVQPCGYYECQEDCDYSSTDTMCRAGCGDNCSPTTENYSSDGCGGVGECGPLVGSCTRVNCSSSTFSQYEPTSEYDCYTANSMNSSDSSRRVSKQITLSKAKGFSKQSVNTRISILQNNTAQNPCGSNCGNGKDACWGGYGGFEPIDNTNNSYYSRVKIKIAASREQMKDYSSVEGKVYFYQDSLPGCCGGGNPIITTNFSLSSSANFQNGTMCATDVYNFENDSMQAYVGSNIIACAKIDRLTLS